MVCLPSVARHHKAWLPNKNTGKVMNHRSGKYLPGCYVYYNEYLNNGDTPKKIQHTKKFSNKPLAQKWCREYNAKLELQQFRNVIMPITLKDAGREFIGGLSARSEETLRQYMQSISLLGQVIGNIEIDKIGRSEIDRFISARLEVSHEATTAKHVGQLKRFFNWCVRACYAAESPIRLATRLPKNNIARKKPRLMPEQCERLFKALDTEDRRLAPVYTYAALSRPKLASGQ